MIICYLSWKTFSTPLVPSPQSTSLFTFFFLLHFYTLGKREERFKFKKKTEKIRVEVDVPKGHEQIEEKRENYLLLPPSKEWVRKLYLKPLGSY